MITEKNLPKDPNELFYENTKALQNWMELTKPELPYERYLPNGLRHTQGLKVGINVLFMPCTFAQTYAHKETVTDVSLNRLDRIDYGIYTFETEKLILDDLEKWNSTTVGDLFYIGMHCKDINIRRLAREVIYQAFILVATKTIEEEKKKNN